MSEYEREAEADAERIQERAQLWPEERASGSDDPQAQAAAILAESDQRIDDPDAAPDSFKEERTSEEAAEAPHPSSTQG